METNETNLPEDNQPEDGLLKDNNIGIPATASIGTPDIPDIMLVFNAEMHHNLALIRGEIIVLTSGMTHTRHEVARRLERIIVEAARIAVSAGLQNVTGSGIVFKDEEKDYIGQAVQPLAKEFSDAHEKKGREHAMVRWINEQKAAANGIGLLDEPVKPIEPAKNLTPTVTGELITGMSGSMGTSTLAPTSTSTSTSTASIPVPLPPLSPDASPWLKPLV